MAEHSAIEWTDHTFNPWVGCTKVSPACDHCYAETRARRAGQAQLWQGERRRTTPANWREPQKWNRRAAERGVRERVFCASLADVFDNNWIAPDGRTFHRQEDLPEEVPCRLIERVGKKAAGRLLDGVEHNGMPGRG